MKKLILFIFCGCGLLWGQPTVVGIFGGESCPWSQELRKEVWDSSSFQSLLASAGIDKKEEKASPSQSETPVLKLISSQGEEIGWLGYLIIPPEKYADLFKEMVSIYELSQNLEKLESSQLLHFYRKCQVLNMKSSEAKILKAGLAKDPGTDFLLEEYAKVAKQHPRQAHKIKTEIRQRKPSSPAIEWQLALLAFQTKNDKAQAVKDVVKPLEKYLRRYGDKDRDSRWRCHLILAEFYKDKEVMEKARYHAQQAMLDAPDELRQMIAPLGSL